MVNYKTSPLALCLEAALWKPCKYQGQLRFTKHVRKLVPASPFVARHFNFALQESFGQVSRNGLFAFVGGMWFLVYLLPFSFLCRACFLTAAVFSESSVLSALTLKETTTVEPAPRTGTALERCWHQVLHQPGESKCQEIETRKARKARKARRNQADSIQLCIEALNQLTLAW